MRSRLRFQRVFDTATLPLKLREIYGMEATYNACSAADMTPESLLAFLLGWAKITEIEGRLHLNRENICKH